MIRRHRLAGGQNMKRLLWCLLLAGFSCLAAESPAVKTLLQELEAKLKGSLVAVPAAEKLLPADTLGFLTVPDWAQGRSSFSNSATGQLWADPAMKAFKEKFFEKFTAEKIQPLEKELGFAFTNFPSRSAPRPG